MYVISGKTVDNNWVYATKFDDPGYSVGVNNAIKFRTIKEANDFYNENKSIYETLKEKAIRKVVFKKKVLLND